MLSTLYTAFLIEMAHGLSGILKVLDDAICKFEFWGK